MNVNFRRMNPGDACGIAIIEKECFSMPWSEKDIIDTFNTGQSIFGVAEIDGEIAGYVGMTFAADEGEITNIAVLSKYRRMGIAEGLLNELHKMAEEEKLSVVFLDVRVGNSPAISLYEKTGYILCGTRKRFYSLPTEDAYIYRRDL